MARSSFPAGSRLSRSIFDRERDAYSATDIEAIIYGRDKSTGDPVIAKIGDIQTLTYSIHRDAAPVRTLGRSNPKAYTMGARTTAGSLIFATFNKRALSELYTASDSINAPDQLGTAIAESDARILQPSDTIPPFDIILYFTSEQGNDSVLTIYRIQIMDESQTFSVQDIYTEHTMQYVAGGISLMEKVDDVWKRSYLGEKAIFKNMATIRQAERAGLIV